MSMLYELGSSGRPNRRERDECTLRVYPGNIAEDTIYCPVLARRDTSAADVIQMLISKLSLERGKCYVLAEVRESGGEEWVLTPGDFPAQRMFLWPRAALDEQGNAVRSREDYRFLLREKNVDGSIRYEGPLHSWLRVTEERRLMVERGLLPASTTQDYDDLCALPDLNERSLLDNLRVRFKQEKIYTYIGAILIAMNPFKFLPIYNPKYVQLYDNHRLGTLQPHVFAVADAAYHNMLRRRINQCIVISGESGSGKTQSTNFLIHHLTALSQKGYASGVEQIILGAGPVLEAFGNAKTAHNNNSSRFGKFIQVNYRENGIVRGAIVEKYLLEKSRLVSQEHNERNYHVFYYLLCGTSKQEREELRLLEPEAYLYLNQTDGYVEEEEDLRHDFKRLQLAMEMVGFLPATRKQIFSLLSAVLHLGNIAYKRRPYREEATEVENPEMLKVLSELLQVKEEMLMEALTTRKAVTVGEKLILPYKLNEAVTARDSMAKSLYSALFDWIVLRINHALMNKMERVHNWLSIGVLDIFGFEDFENNSFEQFCINYANECLHYYFNQHVFKNEQEEYQREGINWNTIDYIDNTGCINLISKKPTGLFHLLDEECNFPQATSETLLAKFKRQNIANKYYEITAIMEPAFIIQHYAGKVKYMIKDFREKNGDHMRPDIVVVLRSSHSSFMRSLVSIDPVALFRWAILRAVFRASFAFRSAAAQAKHKAGDTFPSTTQHELGGYFRHDLFVHLIQMVHSMFFFLFFLQHLLDVKSLKHMVSLTLQDCTTKSLLHVNKKKKPPSITAQFQTSLSKLLETLNQAEPYFIRCIRSNAEKLPLRFDERVVLRQLRYTGMLQTVRIRQTGYSARYTLQEFVEHFRLLLPRRSGKFRDDAMGLLKRTGLDPQSYQLGRTKVFLQEAERQRLLEKLHAEVLRCIVLLQRWCRMCLDRKRFLRARSAAISIQVRFQWCKELLLQRSRQQNMVLGGKDPSEHQTNDENAELAKDKQQPPSQNGGSPCSNVNSSMLNSTDKQIKNDTADYSEQLFISSGVEESPEPQSSDSVTRQERPRSLLLDSEKARARRQNNRQRELDQAAYSLEYRRQRSGNSCPSPTGALAMVKEPSPFTVSPQNDVSKISDFEGVTSESKSNFGNESPLPGVSQRKPRITGGSSNVSGKNVPLSPVVANTELKLSTTEQEDSTPGDFLQSPSKEEAVGELSPTGGSQEDNMSSLSDFDSLEPSETKAEGDALSPDDIANRGELFSNDSKQKMLQQLEESSHAVQERQQWRHLEHQYDCQDIMAVMRMQKNQLTRERLNLQRRQEELLSIVVLSPFNLCNDASIPCFVEAYLVPFALQIQEVNGHHFKSTQFNIPSFCEECGTRIWIMEGGYVCKCVMLIYLKHYLLLLFGGVDGSGKQFAVELSQLVGSDRAVPLLLEKLLNHVEMHGLYTEGIYRKSGANTKVKELRSALDSDISNVSLDDYQVHVIGSVIKQWLRELPSPLLTNELYDEFLRTVELPEKKDKVKGLYSVIEHLPPSNHSTLERLIFHLVRITQHGETNRMSPNALAIVFAPCILRSPDNMDPLQSVKDIAQTTHCVELLITEQLKKFKARIQDISTLKSVENSASQRLSLIRTSIGKGKHRRQRVPEGLRVLGGLADLSPLEVGDQQAEAEENSEQGMSESEAAFVEEEVQLSKEYDNIQKRKYVPCFVC
uniref:Myosin IXB n=1 Tax=Eptatretus burgeri TaxID=7764 RepID=A0A8C4PXY3_EPTBU